MLKEEGIYYYPTLPLITDFDDTETNIFNISDIETKTSVYINIIGKTSKYYRKCRLWKPKTGKLRFFCDLDNLKSSENNITFERFNFIYNGQTIIVKTDDYFQIKVLDYAISFLYSDIQIIDLEQELESYNLRFKFDLYNNKDVFYIFSGNSYILLDN